MGGCVARQKELTDPPWDPPVQQQPTLVTDNNNVAIGSADSKPQTPCNTQRQMPGRAGSRTATPTRSATHEVVVNKSVASLSNASSRTGSPQHAVHTPDLRRTSLPHKVAQAVCIDEVGILDSPCRRGANGTPVPLISCAGPGSKSSSLKHFQAQQQMQQQQQATLIIAMFDYTARTDGELTFSAGDTLVLIDTVNPDWWYVEHRANRLRGYIPSALVAAQDSLEAQSWFLGPLQRKEAERQLLTAGNCRGTFLVRESETHRESYSLSVLDYDDGKARNTVKHYRIRLLDGGAGYYITSRHKFASMQALIENYSVSADGLCCRLTATCPRQQPTIADLSYQTRDQWEIPREQVELVELIGSGQFGDVYRGLFNKRLEVAVKMLKAGSMSRADFLKEARIMKRLRHPKLVQLFAVCTGEDPVYIVTELMKRGSLLTYLREASCRLEMPVLADILGQIASGMSYLESEKFVHRDLAARNILVGENNVVKVADFGLSRAIADSGEYTAKEGAKFPIKWTSPEAAGLGKFSTKSDIWSFGIVCFEVITHGQVPYAGMSNTETLREVEDGYRLPRPSECPQALYEIMLSCWEWQPEHRPTFTYLRDFFDDFFPASEPNYRQTVNEAVQPQLV